ncbi:hypothetical protein ACOSQ4_020899 [Xanthoceras sorbifolium]
MRGQVEVKSAIDNKNWNNLNKSNGVLVSPKSGDKAVIQRMQTERRLLLSTIILLNSRLVMKRNRLVIIQ